MRLYCGTSGFAFKQWKGPFYPQKLPANRMLSFYAERLPTVEINNTFYRMPKAETLERWAAQVPETFRFAVKAPRRITHFKQLADCEAEAEYFFGAVAKLGPRLGAVLLQLPPHARVAVDKLERFLDGVPAGSPLAFEFRHASWQDERVYASLERYGAAWVTMDEAGTTPPALPRTAPWTYLRLRAPDYSPSVLRAWKRRLADFDRAFVYFKHEDEARGPALAERMMAL
jgi:uncharacterized protein YecE (DUF72 family)